MLFRKLTGILRLLATQAKAQKRGLDYTNAALTSAFNVCSQISWAYRYGQTLGGTLATSLESVPMLYSAGANQTWNANAQAAINADTTLDKENKVKGL